MTKKISLNLSDWILVYTSKYSALRVLIRKLEENFTYRHLSRLMGYNVCIQSRAHPINNLKEKNRCTVERLLHVYNVYKQHGLVPPISVQDAVIQADKIVNRCSGEPIEKYVQEGRL